MGNIIKIFRKYFEKLFKDGESNRTTYGFSMTIQRAMPRNYGALLFKLVRYSYKAYYPTHSHLLFEDNYDINSYDLCGIH